MYLKIPKDRKEQIVYDIQDFFAQEREEEIGELAAGFLLDFMVEELAPILYNQAIEDVQHLVLQKMSLMEEDIQALKMSARIKRE